MYHQSMLGIFGARIFIIGWAERIIRIEYGDEHEILQKQTDVIQQKNEDNDHVHVFVSAPPKISVTNIVKYLKGISGNTILSEFPELRNSLWKGNLWNCSYFAETIGSTSEENIRAYIERQQNAQH